MTRHPARMPGSAPPAWMSQLRARVVGTAKTLGLASAVLLCAAPPAGAAPDAAAVVDEAGAPADPVVRGTLANGLAYAILPRRGGEPGVAVLLRVRGGFLAERRPGERGLAHLVEHLVFLSPTTAAPDSYRRFREVGMPLTKASPAGGTTSWRESDYFVVSRSDDAADLETLLGLFREVAAGLTLRADAVSAAKADVLREMADKRLGNAIHAGYVAAVAPGAPTDVIDGQNSDDVAEASEAAIRSFYARVYRPENTTLVLVGAVDPAAVAAAIERRFGDWRGTGPGEALPAVPAPRLDTVGPVSFSGLAFGRNTVMLTSTATLPANAQDRGQQVRDTLLAMVAVQAGNTRLAPAYAANPPGKYGMHFDDGELGFRQMMFWDDYVPGEWRGAVERLSGLVCGIASDGFTAEETQAARAAVIADLAARARAAPSAPPLPVAKAIADAAARQRAWFDPAALSMGAGELLPSLGPEELDAWWRQQWLSGSRHLRLESTDLRRNPLTAKEGADLVGCVKRG